MKIIAVWSEPYIIQDDGEINVVTNIYALTDSGWLLKQELDESKKEYYWKKQNIMEIRS